MLLIFIISILIVIVIVKAYSDDKHRPEPDVQLRNPAGHPWLGYIQQSPIVPYTCPSHGETEKCQYTSHGNNPCIECNGGMGFEKNRWCKRCFEGWIRSEPIDWDNDD